MDHKKHKFDRQIRLWGVHGQSALENAHVLVIGSGGVAAETLKNLVLPNLKAFTVVDHTLVSQVDLSSSFFVSHDGIGMPRAQVVCELVKELNPSVQGYAVIANPEELTDDFFVKFNMVIGTQISEEFALRLANLLYPKEIPFLNVKVNGMIGWARLAVPEHQIVETHPENDRFDLGIYPELLNHWPEYKKFLFSFDLNVKDEQDHAHIPFVAILAQLTAKFMQDHGGKLPTSRDEQNEFKGSIKKHSRGGMNFSEAEQYWYYACKHPSSRLDSFAEAALNSDQVEKDKSDFWVMVFALKKFVQNEGHGFWPVTSNIPDMTCFPQNYVEIKKIFEARVAAEFGYISNYAKQRLLQVGRRDNEIDAETLANFIKNSKNLRVEKYRSFASEYEGDDIFKEAVGEVLNVMDEDEEETEGAAPKFPHNMHFYLGMRACDRFFTKFKRYPGQFSNHDEELLANDSAELQAILEDLFKDLGFNTSAIISDVLKELTRYGGSEIGTICSMMGSLAAQATLKLVTRQYVPFNNTILLNMINCTLDRFPL